MNNALSPRLSKTDHEWRGRKKHFLENRHRLNTAAAIMIYAQRHDESGFNVRWRINEETKPKLMAILEALRKEFPTFVFPSEHLCESRLSMQGTLCEVDGQPISNTFLWHLRAYLSCVTYLGGVPQAVLEIGAGYGGLARLFGMNNPEIKYTIMDIPESLFFSRFFLETSLPNVDWVFIEPDEPVEQYAYDVAINQACWQHMEVETIEGYCALLSRLGVPVIYSCNYSQTPIPLERYGYRVHYEIPRPESVILQSPLDWMERIYTRRAA